MCLPSYLIPSLDQIKARKILSKSWSQHCCFKMVFSIFAVGRLSSIRIPISLTRNCQTWWSLDSILDLTLNRCLASSLKACTHKSWKYTSAARRLTFRRTYYFWTTSTSTCFSKHFLKSSLQAFSSTTMEAWRTTRRFLTEAVLPNSSRICKRCSWFLWVCSRSSRYQDRRLGQATLAKTSRQIKRSVASTQKQWRPRRNTCWWSSKTTTLKSNRKQSPCSRSWQSHQVLETNISLRTKSSKHILPHYRRNIWISSKKQKANTNKR